VTRASAISPTNPAASARDQAGIGQWAPCRIPAGAAGDQQRHGCQPEPALEAKDCVGIGTPGDDARTRQQQRPADARQAPRRHPDADPGRRIGSFYRLRRFAEAAPGEAGQDHGRRQHDGPGGAPVRLEQECFAGGAREARQRAQRHTPVDPGHRAGGGANAQRQTQSHGRLLSLW
jgi:hypothetical protein